MHQAILLRNNKNVLAWYDYVSVWLPTNKNMQTKKQLYPIKSKNVTYYVLKPFNWVAYQGLASCTAAKSESL